MASALALSKTIDKHKGQIRLMSKPGQTIFQIHLPCKLEKLDKTTEYHIVYAHLKRKKYKEIYILVVIFNKIGYHSIRANNYNIKGVHMIKLLIGKPGSGKTKEMISHANDALKTAKGTILFINESNDSMLEIHHNIRYINISEYPIESSQEIIPFIYGLLSTDHDISKFI